MKPPMSSNPLKDSGEQRAIANRVADQLREAFQAGQSHDSSEMARLIAENVVGDHERGCREGGGPIATMRGEVSSLKAWAKVAAVMLMLTPLWLVIGGYALTGYMVSKFQNTHASSGNFIVPSASASTKAP